MWRPIADFSTLKGKPFVHRDLSWLDFNLRVLRQAKDNSQPLLERLKFLAITSSNLDEFFMIRYSSVLRSLSRSKANLEQLQQTHDAILSSVKKFSSGQSKTLDEISRSLASEGFQFLRYREKQPALLQLGEQLFREQVSKQLPELEIFSPEKLQRLQNLQSAIVFPNGLFAPIPTELPKILWINKSSRSLLVAFLDDLLLRYWGRFMGIQDEPSILRLTRNADIDVDIADEDPASIPDIIKEKIQKRDVGKAVRLQVYGSKRPIQIEELSKTLGIQNEQVFKVSYPLNLDAGFKFVNQVSKTELPKRKLIYPRLKTQPKFISGNVFEQISTRDYLLHHPYDSFDNYVEFIRSASKDPKVKSIYQTVYRVDTLSEVTELLQSAAKTKDVHVVIEPRARFDEINNIELAESMRKSGAKVHFAFGELKMHAKIALIRRQEEAGIKLYTHLSTGNYNSQTARVYTDLAILTADQEIGRDAEKFFHSVAHEKIPTGLKTLVLAPTQLHRRLLSLISQEIRAARSGKDAEIFAKVNALVDPGVVDKLYEASDAGVKVNLLVRGACSLIPRIEGVSDNIKVISIVDRFLEHSRIYYFKSANQLYLSSADWMPRNFFSRLEIAFPILDPRLFKFMIETVLPTYMGDRFKGMELSKFGTWKKRRLASQSESTQAQEIFLRLAKNKYRGTELAS